MRLTEPAARPQVLQHAVSPARAEAPSSSKVSSQAVEEINAYIAIRDQSLADAERVPTRGTVNRALLANDFVENCLRPVRSPYEAQVLPETAAAAERKRCIHAKARLAQLSARVGDTRCAAAA